MDTEEKLVPAENPAEEKEEDSHPLVTLTIALCAVLLGVLSEFAFHAPWYVCMALYAVGTLAAGHEVLKEGLSGILHLDFNEDALMAVSVVAAFCLGEYLEAAAVAVLFFLGELAEEHAEGSSRREIAQLAKIRPDTAHPFTESFDDLQTLPAADFQPGDVILIAPYERVPLDCTVLSGSGPVDTSALTGESLPLICIPGTALLGGFVNGSGVLSAQVTAGYTDSAAARVLRLVEDAQEKKGHTEKLITRIARIYTPVFIVLALLVAIVPPLLHFGPFSMWLYRALSFLVASCPCALVISVPLAFFFGMGAQSKSGMLIKGGKYIELLARAKTVLLDKTGTLTTGTLTLRDILPAEGYEEDSLLTLAAAAEQLSAHPIALALTQAADERELSLPPTGDPEELAGLGVQAIVSGKTVLVGRQSFLEQQGVSCTQAPTDATLFCAVNGTYAGAFTFTDELRPDAAESIAQLKKSGISRIALLTGDSEAAAARAAKDCGITEVHAGLLPGEKLEIVRAAKAPRKPVLFVGDGINDAPALTAADCGIAMGLGTAAAMEACDAVLSGENIRILVSSIRLAKSTVALVRALIGFILLVKIAVPVLSFFGLTPLWVAVAADVGLTLVCLLLVTALTAWAQKKICK